MPLIHRTSENSVKWKSNFRENPECELRLIGFLRSSPVSGSANIAFTEFSEVRNARPERLRNTR
jgi:hypothetical protein